MLQWRSQEVRGVKIAENMTKKTANSEQSQPKRKVVQVAAGKAVGAGLLGHFRTVTINQLHGLRNT